MIIFGGLFAALFYTVLIGTLWRPAPSEKAFQTALGYVGKSLWLSWALVTVSYFTNLGNLLWPLVVAVLATHVWRYNSQDSRVLLSAEVSHLKGLVFVAVVTAVAFITASVGNGHTFLFNEWDAVVSWNRWALELFDNTFKPYEAAYPVLFPGIWSLIYKAQGTAEVWFIAKASLLILPIMLVLTVLALFEEKLFSSALVALGFVTYFFLVKHQFALIGGYMDAPVAAMMFIAGCLLVVAANADPQDKRGSHLVNAAVFIGLASITKQPGGILWLPLFVILIMDVLRQRLSFTSALRIAGIAVVPAALFMVLFFSEQASPLGNLPGLTALADNASGGRKFFNALALVTGMLPGWLLLVIVGLAASNLVNLRHPSSLLGALLLLCAGIGFAVFADCCSYDARNGWWVVSLLVASGFCALSQLDQKLGWALAAGRTISVRASVIAIPVAVVGLVCAGLLGLRYSDAVARNFQIERQWLMGWADVNDGLRRHLPLVGESGLLVSTYQWAGHLPEIGHHYRLCHGHQSDCVAMYAEQAPILVLTGPDWMDYPELRPQLTDDKLIETFEYGRQLYGPFHPGELHRIH